MRTPLDIYDDMPDDMRKYISNYGWHFNTKALHYAVDCICHEGFKGLKKEDIDNMLASYGVVLEHNTLNDYVYVANMTRADHPGSIDSDARLCTYIKETIDDADASGETTFRRWVATMVGNGMPIDWSEIV